MAKTLEEIVNNEDPQVVEAAKAMATIMLLDINLAELTQNEVADDCQFATQSLPVKPA
jgi:hypothetical protein